MPTTDVHGFLKWAAGLSQFDVVFNDLLDQLDVKLGLAVLSRVLTAPPGGETGGERYIMPSGTLTGAWASFSEDDIAIYRDGSWVAFAPISGQVAWDTAANEGLTFETGSGWAVTSQDLSAYATIAYVNSVLAGLVELQGDYDASTNTPDLDTAPSGIFKGDAWECSVAGTFFTFALDVGDIVIAKQDDPTTEAHWIINKEAGGGGAGGLAASVKTANYTITGAEDVGVDSTGGVFTITLKATPSAGDVAFIHDTAFNCGTDAVAIARNGSTINGLAEDASLNMDGGGFWFIYTGTTWVFTPVTSGGLSEAEVDLRVVAVAPTANQSIGFGPSSTFNVSATLADDSVFVVPMPVGLVSVGTLVMASTGDAYGTFCFRPRNSPFMYSISSAGLTTTTGVLTGTTGADGAVTLSAGGDNSIYVENRLGATIFVVLTIGVTQ